MLELKKRRRRGAKNRVDITRDNFRPLSHFWNIFSPEFLEDLFPHSDPWSFMNFDILKNLGPYEVEITSILFSVFPKFLMSSHPGPRSQVPSAQRFCNLRILLLGCWDAGMFSKSIRITFGSPAPADIDELLSWVHTCAPSRHIFFSNLLCFGQLVLRNMILNWPVSIWFIELPLLN